jgi:uroporphyrinogen-III synthase
VFDYASELAEIITLIYNKESYTFERKFAQRNVARSIKSAGISFNEIEVYQTSWPHLKYPIKRNLMAYCFFCGRELFNKQ